MKKIFPIAAVVLVVGLIVVLFFMKDKSDVLLIKNLPINIEKYDSKTGMAGDMKFSDIKLELGLMYYDYGYVVPANSVSNQRSNPQPTFLAPLGTKVLAIVDGEVVKVEKIYSNDYTIMISKSKNSNYYYEHEHVINPMVKVGDVVKASDPIAEVSDYDTRNTPGYGLVEIGVLIGGNPPTHICPFLYLDPASKDSILGKMEQLYKDWNEYKGQTIYDTNLYESIGCITEAKIED